MKELNENQVQDVNGGVNVLEAAWDAGVAVGQWLASLIK
ncbi:hypothetical protein PESP_a3869 [Pseudoalteromonas espejiana DSM 9414]|nr:hypothetical protein PESP_a3868 [Pseudoalteromonas espejiana DSM 9414]ASM51616.1 hypothetical protein PESP_a3869 [Pseudoalteromonas espejiana DSM 9414]